MADTLLTFQKTVQLGCRERGEEGPRKLYYACMHIAPLVPGGKLRLYFYSCRGPVNFWERYAHLGKNKNKSLLAMMLRMLGLKCDGWKRKPKNETEDISETKRKSIQNPGKVGRGST